MNKQAILKLCDFIVESEELDQNGQHEEAEDLLIAVCEALDTMTRTSAVNPFSNPLFWKQPLDFLQHAGMDLLGRVPRGAWGKALSSSAQNTINQLVGAADEAAVKQIMPNIKDKIAKKIAVAVDPVEIHQILKANKLLQNSSGTLMRPLTKLQLSGAGIAGAYGLVKDLAGFGQRDKSRGEIFPETPEDSGEPSPINPYQPYSGGSAYK